MVQFVHGITGIQKHANIIIYKVDTSMINQAVNYAQMGISEYLKPRLHVPNRFNLKRFEAVQIAFTRN